METETKIKELNYKSLVEEKLQEIKKNKVDILILNRKNEDLCRENNQKVEELTTIVGRLEIEIESLLRESKQKKIDTPVGFASFREMPDYWEYDDEAILDWCEKKKMPYYKTIQVIEKLKLKQDIQSGVLPVVEVQGITIKPQEPKFNYKIREVF